MMATEKTSRITKKIEPSLYFIETGRLFDSAIVISPFFIWVNLTNYILWGLSFTLYIV